jgi:hypothetical protein
MQHQAMLNDYNFLMLKALQVGLRLFVGKHFPEA